MNIERLSNYVTYNEFVKSNTATLNKIDNTPNKEQLANGRYVATEIYDEVKGYFPLVFISSFFRSKSLNTKVKGSRRSQHMTGEAIDIDSNSTVYNKLVFDWIKNNLEFDQLINEYPDKNGNPSWVHVSIKRNGKNRKQILIIK